MQQQTKNQLITVAFVGAPKSGKSCLVTGYTETYTTTIGVDYAKYTFPINNINIDFAMWDISGSMTFNDKNLEFCKKAEIVALVYAVNDRNSFNDCQQLAERLLKQDLMRYDAKVVLVGTKTDLPAQVTYFQGIQAGMILKDNPNSQVQSYFEVSTKTDPDAVRKFCEGIYKVHKDPTYKTVSALSQVYSQQSPAPQQKPQKPLTLSYGANQKAFAVQPPQFSRLYKVVLLGNEACGKSSIVSQFARFEFLNEYIPTIGVDFAIRVLDVMGERIKFQVWDTAGIKKFQTITSCYIKGCQAAIIVFDVSNYQTFQQASEYLELINKHSSKPQHMCKYLVGNKIDKQRKVSREEAQFYAQMHGYVYMEVSALQNINVDELFYNVGDSLLKLEAVAPKE